MHLIIEERVEHSLRYLRPTESEKVTRTFEELERTDFAHWREKFKVVKSQTSGVQPFFVIRVNPRLRIICRYGENETLIIEDIVTHEGLEKFASGKQRR
jgi:hypothetical protein